MNKAREKIRTTSMTMSFFRERPWLVWIGLSIWAITLFLRYRGAAGLDLSALYFAAKFFGDGFASDVYGTGARLLGETPSIGWLLAGEKEGLTEDQLTPYVYPPLWAVLFSPLAPNIGLRSFLQGGLAVLILSLLALIWSSWRISEARVAWPVWALASVLLVEVAAPFVLALDLMQPQILVAGLIVGSFLALKMERDMTAGGLLAVAAALKLSPAVLVVLFLARRRFRAFGWFVGIGGGLGLLSIALAGWPLHALFLERLALTGETALLSRVNLSFLPILAMATEPQFIDANAGYIWLNAPRWLPLFGAALMAVTLIAAWPLIAKGRWVLGMTLVSLGLLLASPLSWTHYAILPLCFLPSLLSGRRSMLVALILLLAVSSPVFAQLVGGQVLLLAGYGTGLVLLSFGAVAWRALGSAKPGDLEQGDFE